MRLRAVVLTALTGAALAVPVAPAAAAACTSGSGVTVVVDFASLSGGTQTRCASGDPASGVAALRGAGFTPTRAAQEPGYFVCRIDGKPANDPCQRTSPADAYWSYWHAKPGGTWTYSDLGPADYDPAPGTVEGWAFGAGKPPSSPPPRPSQPSPSPPAASPSAPQPDATPAAAVSEPSPAPHRSASLTATPASGSAPASPPAADAAAPSPVATPATSPSTAPNSVTKTVGEPVRTVPYSVLAAGVLVLLLLGAAARQVIRRRREGGG